MQITYLLVYTNFFVSVKMIYQVFYTNLEKKERP